MEILTGATHGEPCALLAQARSDHARGDLQEASGKGWDAFAQRLCAVAEGRGWPHRTHRDLFMAINRIAKETGDRQLLTQIASAIVLHTNFFEGWLPRDWVERDLDQIAELVGKLDALDA